MSVLFSVRVSDYHLFGKKLFIRFFDSVLRESLSICMCASFPFGFEGGM